jgi:phospholipase/carboxylesterase
MFRTLGESDHPIEISTAPGPGAAVIWLHGLGADGWDFVPIVEQLDLAGLGPIRFVFPHAPMRPVTINGGMVMRAWYDILSLDFAGRREDEASVRESAATVLGLVERESARGIPDARIVVAGFSQGGVIALHAGLRHPRRLAGVLALSTYLALPDSLAAEAAAANRDVPILLAHGRDDAVIAAEHGRRSRDQLAAAGYAVEWQEYFMEHAVCAEELRDIGAWLRRVLADQPPATR